ncbi:MAG: hypothetical protein K2M46_02830 [Lachnospiraceae bacterium]|nr:hypothetical protein [Lachnospiraceae bacterium]
MKISKIQRLIVLELFSLMVLCGILCTLSSEPSVLPSNSSATVSVTPSPAAQKDYIKWVDFQVTCEAMKDAYHYDIETYQTSTHLNWISLLAYLAAKNGGNFQNYKSADMKKLADTLLSGENTLEGLTKDMKYYNYYLEAYTAVLGGMVGEYEIETASNSTNTSPVYQQQYGLKAFLPIAKNFPYSDYDDFGASRSYGYNRPHLGHDMMGQTGTPIINKIVTIQYLHSYKQRTMQNCLRQWFFACYIHFFLRSVQ